jgi:hypothetical protein
MIFVLQVSSLLFSGFPPKYHSVSSVHLGLSVGVILSGLVHTLYSILVQSSLLMIISNSSVRVAIIFSFGLFSVKDGYLGKSHLETQ